MLTFSTPEQQLFPWLTDQEVITVYLFGLLQRRFTHKDTYDLMKNYWLSWFPQLPSYQGYTHRINQLHWQLEVIESELMSQPPEF